MFEINFINKTIKKVEFSGTAKLDLNLRDDLDQAKKDLIFEIKQEIDRLKYDAEKINNLTIDDVSQLGLF